jgi:uncharacterized protein YceK
MLHGCGTVRNTEGPLPESEEFKDGLEGLVGPPGGRQIYGGVTFDLVGGTQALFDTNDILPFWHLAGAYLVIVDLPLSFVTDTLTLPWTINATMNRLRDRQGAEPGQNGAAPSTSDPANLQVPPCPMIPISR